MQNYHRLISNILVRGHDVQDRTGVGTRKIFGTRLEWDLKNGFPAVTTKKLAWKSLVGELLWFLEGSDNVERLREITHGEENKPTIWDANYKKQAKDLDYHSGYLGPIYGVQWRNFFGVDQIKNLIKGLKENPHDRRHLVSAWNPAQLDEMALPPCHYSFQCFVDRYNNLSLMWNQRSVDVFLGLPFNIASYALLCHILAEICNMQVGSLIFNGGDTHIYTNHFEQCRELLSRDPYDLPFLALPELKSLDDVLSSCPSDYNLINYKHHPTIKAPMAA